MNSNNGSVMVSLDKKVEDVLKPQQPSSQLPGNMSGLANVANTHKISSRFLIVDTTPDVNIEWTESYQCESWKDAYGKMVRLVLETSQDNLEQNLVNGNAFIKPYSAQTFDEKGARHVYHIIGV